MLELIVGCRVFGNCISVSCGLVCVSRIMVWPVLIIWLGSVRVSMMILSVLVSSSA